MVSSENPEPLFLLSHLLLGLFILPRTVVRADELPSTRVEPATFAPRRKIALVEIQIAGKMYPTNIPSVAQQSSGGARRRIGADRDAGPRGKPAVTSSSLPACLEAVRPPPGGGGGAAASRVEEEPQAAANDGNAGNNGNNGDNGDNGNDSSRADVEEISIPPPPA